MTTTRIPRITLEKRLVSDVMRDGVVGCTPETTVAEVARLMSEYRVHCVVVAGLEEDGHADAPRLGRRVRLDLARAVATGRGAHRRAGRRDRAGHGLAHRHAGRRRPG